MESKLRRGLLRSTYNELGALIHRLQEFPSHYIRDQDFKDLKVTVSSLDIEDDAVIDFEPRFFRMCPAIEFENKFHQLHEKPELDEHRSPWWEYPRYEIGFEVLSYVQYFLDWELEALVDKPLWVRSGFGDTYHAMHSECVDNDEAAWSTGYLLAVTPYPEDALDAKYLHYQKIRAEKDPQKPPPPVHIACTLLDGNMINDGDESSRVLLRSEMMVAANLMREQMRQRIHWDHYQFPVFVYTFSGRNVRVLQFHIDHLHNTLAVRVTPFMYVDDASEEGLRSTKLILRCMLSTPIGQTTFESLDIEIDSAVDGDQGPRTPRLSSPYQSIASLQLLHDHITHHSRALDIAYRGKVEQLAPLKLQHAH